MVLKIAVYTIALNEEKFIERWYKSAKDADLLLIADTGSTDNTISKARKLGIQVEEINVEPWRFDVARNLNLAMIPDDFDICIQLDMDEILPEGWRLKVEEAFHGGNVWPRYKHVWKRRQDGTPLIFQPYFKIHPRHGLHWVFPIHEMLVLNDGVTLKSDELDLEVDHLQDESKSRSSYLDLLELAVIETPEEWRMNFYLQREYRLHNRWSEVLKAGSKALALPAGVSIERASACMWNAEAAYELGFTDWAIEWADRGIWEAPLFFEPKGLRAHLAYLQHDWTTCHKFAIQVLSCSRIDYIHARPEYWDWYMYDLIALSAYHLGKQDEALHFGQLAIQGRPDDERLKANLKYYENPNEVTSDE